MKKRSQDKPRRLRFVRTILIFLVLGVVVNVGVAWASLNCTECGTPIPPVHARIIKSGMVGRDG